MDDTKDTDKLLLDTIRDGIRKGVAEKLTGYGSPLGPLIEAALNKHSATFRSMLENAIGSCVDDPQFREEIAVAVRHSLAKTLIQRFGGEMEKQVNVLKSDPTTRARITLAIEEIVKSKGN